MEDDLALSAHSTSPIRVFISYSHDSSEHKERVLALSERLRVEGLDVQLDQYEKAPPQGWPNWMLDQISDARWVLLVCTERYHQRVRGGEKSGSGLGATWEGAIITQTLYENQAKNDKFVPVIFAPEDRIFIPIFLRGSTHYLLGDDYEILYWHLRDVPLVHKSPIGPLRELRPRIVPPLPVGLHSAALQEGGRIEPDEPEGTRPLLSTSTPLAEKSAIRGGGQTDQMRGHMFRSLVSHLHAAGDCERLFTLIETKPFLADQALHLGGFEHGSRDLESFAIPATIQKGDWPRFFHYSILALNLRGIAEMLAQPEILKSLSRADSLSWATSVAGLLFDPLDRAEALATIAESYDVNAPEKFALVERLRDELDSVPLSIGQRADVERRTEALCNIGRKLGPELYGSWGTWITLFSLGAKEARRIRRAVVESWIDRGNLQTPTFWERLRTMDDPLALLEIVRSRLCSASAVLPGDTIDRLEPLFQGRADLFHRARAILLGRQAREAPARASSLLNRWIEGYEMTWAPEMIEDAAELISYTSPTDLDLLAQELPTSLLRAALRVVALEALPNATRAADAWQEVEAISEPAARLHWSLRYLASRPRVPIASYQQQVLAIRDYLRSLRYCAAPEDLCRYLDLIAEAMPTELENEIEALLLAPRSSPEAVSSIAQGTKAKAVAELLLGKAERLAALNAPTEEEGFRWRYSLITQAVCRLCLLTGDLSFLERRAESLETQEEDELRSLLAPQLAELEKRDPRQHRLSSLVCDGIQEPRRRLLTLLKIAPPERLSHALQPASLYREMSDVSRLEDEVLGLAALQERPLDPLSWVHENLSLFKETSHSARVILRLAWHTLRSQNGKMSGLEVVDSFLRAGDDLVLAKLIPQVVEFVVHAGETERAIGEFQKAALDIFAMPCPWDDRLEDFEDLLAIFRKVFLGDAALFDASQATSVIKTFLRLPLDLKTKSSRAELRDHWPKILPLITGTLELLPQDVQPSCRRHLEASACVLSPGHEWLSSVCCSGPTKRHDLALRILETNSPDPDQVVALVYLLARPAPELIVQLLARCLGEKDRSRLCLRLIRHGWVSRETNLALRKLLTDEADRLQANIWTFPRRLAEAEDWLRALGDLLGDLDLSDPRTEALIRELWGCPPNVGHPILATALVEVLRTRGRNRAESALRFWLHGFLAPSLGSENARGQVRVAELRQVLRKAMALPAT